MNASRPRAVEERLAVSLLVVFFNDDDSVVAKAEAFDGVFCEELALLA